MEVRVARPLKSLAAVLSVLLVCLFTGTAAAQTRGGPPPWEFNPGPDPATKMGRELVDIYAELPEYMAISDAMMEKQKFRYTFGMMLTRTYFEPNNVKVLFIGQDATHIAEAAKQPGTSGFGARVQSIGNYFGVDQSVATTNAYLSTIQGQYGAFDHPIVELDSAGKAKVRPMSYVDNELWMLSNGRKSEILLKREKFWEWMIRNNPDTMDLMVMFGGAARDSFAEFLISRGAQVGTKLDPERLKRIQVPETRLVYAGGNNEFPVPIDKDGKDIYETLLREKLGVDELKKRKWIDRYGHLDYSVADVQKEAALVLQESGERGIRMMVFTGGGVNGSGVMNAAQLGGYDLDDVVINGKKTNSLKGLKLSDGTVIERHIGFTMSAHPSSLSKMTPQDASAALKNSFARLEDLKKEGWKVTPDLDESGKPMKNLWDEGIDYKYGRADIRPGYFEFGAPDDRRVSRADASRLDRQVIVAGSRDRVKFDEEAIERAKKGVPSSPKDPNDLWSVRPRQKPARYEFDRGPGKETAKVLWESLDPEKLFEPKPGKRVLKAGKDLTFETHGIDAYYTKTHPGTGLFGFHRGNFDNFRVLLLADPHGLDDWNTSRALTGARGQYLNGLMADLGVGEDYLVLKTVPVGMDGATVDEWEVVRKRTEKFREVAIGKALENNKVEAIFTDGKVAQAEMERVLAKLGRTDLGVVNIERVGMDPKSGILDAGETAKKKISAFSGKEIKGKMVDIPRSHLPWWARTWEGTSGDLVIDATGKQKGGVRALVAPDWVAKQDVRPSKEVVASINALKQELDAAGIRIENEPIESFLARRGTEGRLVPPARVRGARGQRCNPIITALGMEK